LENKIENPSELKKLDRYLRKAFQNEVKPSAEKPPELAQIEKAKEEWIEGFRDNARRRVSFLLAKLKPEQITPELRRLMVIRNRLLEYPYALSGSPYYDIKLPNGVFKPNFRIAEDLTVNIIKELEKVIAEIQNLT